VPREPADRPAIARIAAAEPGRAALVSAPSSRAATASAPVPVYASAAAVAAPTAVVATSAAPAADTASSAAPAPELGDRWADAVQRMIAAGSIGALVRELAMQAQCVAIDDAAAPPWWRLRVEREMLRAPVQCEKLQAALSELLGANVRIEIEAGVGIDTPARRESAERERRQAEAEQTIRNDPLVQALMAQYKTARIVPGSVKSL
ncbi:MAG: DNA polymerase III subunit gamma/tau C-terminal domain-containing protein, partial [Caldimonas sp.]